MQLKWLVMRTELQIIEVRLIRNLLNGHRTKKTYATFQHRRTIIHGMARDHNHAHLHGEVLA